MCSVTSSEQIAYINEALLLEHENYVLLSETPGLVDVFVNDNVVFDAESVEKVLRKEGAKLVLEKILGRFQALDKLTAENTEKACRDLAQEAGLKTGQVFHPVRVADSGRTKGPSLFHMLEVLGKTRSCARIQVALSKTDFFPT